MSRSRVRMRGGGRGESGDDLRFAYAQPRR